MSFWAYILHCRGGYFYVGHTDDLERRIAEHQSGLIPGFTADHQPVELVWSDHFENRDDAKAAEHKLKGWGRAKKLALIRGDWERISALAKKKDSPSTSSGKTGEEFLFHKYPVHAEPVEALPFSLEPHPDIPSSAVDSITVDLFRPTPKHLTVVFTLTGDLDRVLLPKRTLSNRADNLWQSTCLEIFVVAADGEDYAEFNLSPSGQWAAYQFDGYRRGMRELVLDVSPELRDQRRSKFEATFEARISFKFAHARNLALSAVIEELDGAKSYWALTHPPGKPDFHHPSCFTATLPPPTVP